MDSMVTVTDILGPFLNDMLYEIMPHFKDLETGQFIAQKLAKNQGF